MRKRKYYTYNPETDDFERVFPTLRSRLWGYGRFIAASCFFGILFFLVTFYWLDTPTERHLKEENAQLRSNYSILNKRLENAIDIMENIRERDDNLYRVLLQMDPMGKSSRLAGLDNENRYKNIKDLSDAAFSNMLTRKMDYLERQIYAQTISFDQLKEKIASESSSLSGVPSLMPVDKGVFKLSGGFGMRRDPFTQSPVFHNGLDIAAPEGSAVFAVADGVVKESAREGVEGYKIEIDHSSGYASRYLHLSELLVETGKTVHRGDLIGKVGNTGKSVAPHLHFEITLNGEARNPVNYFFMQLTPSELAKMLRKSENAAQILD